MAQIPVLSENMLAIIIGIKDYTNLPKLEAADNNANEFSNMLKKRKYCGGQTNVNMGGVAEGVPDEQILKKTDGAKDAAELRNEIKLFVNKSFSNKIDLILFYYSGHGAYDLDKKQYYLSVTNTDEEDLKGTALEMTDIAELITKTGKKIVFIIDSCFSGSSFSSVSSKADFYIMASSKYNETTKYPEKQFYSAFTAAFVSTINDGISGAGSCITFNDIFKEVKEKLASIKFPLPEKIDKNEAGDIVFENNNYKDNTPTFDLDAAITSIYNSFYPDQSISGETTSKIVLNSFPLNIAVYIRNIFADKKLLNDTAFLQEFYYQIIHFLSFIFIKDLTRSYLNKTTNTPTSESNSTKNFLSDEDGKFFNSWKKTKTSNNDINHFYIDVIRRSFTKYKDKFFIEELKLPSKILDIINHIETFFSDDRVFLESNFIDFRKFLFMFLAELKFLKAYDLLAVKFIEVKKSFYEKIVFEHEVSSLFGPDPGEYKTTPVLESENDFLNNAIIFLPKIITKNQLTSTIAQHKFLNLWPFLIDGNGNDIDAHVPTLCVFEDITEDVDKHYNYLSVQYTKERKNKLEYSSLKVYPSKEEWDNFYIS